MYKYVLHITTARMNNFKTIYFKKWDSQSDGQSIFISHRQGYFVAVTYTQSKEFKTLKVALKRMERKGYSK